MDTYPEVQVYAAVVDETLTDDGIVLPGLGDAGDRQFGTSTTTMMSALAHSTSSDNLAVFYDEINNSWHAGGKPPPSKNVDASVNGDGQDAKRLRLEPS
jgi:Uracil phosphoribosyltransferase